MMQHASQGLRNTTRKVSNGLVHNAGHSGQGNTTNQSRSVHIAAQLRSATHPTFFSFDSIRPRTQNKLFSASKNFLQRFFTYLTAPGIRVPVHVSQVAQGSVTRSLHNGARIPTIQGGLSFTARHALRNNALHRRTGTFLPSGPIPPRPPFGGISNLGLGAARNFTTGRPIFENLVQNVPLAARALYEVDWDIEMRNELGKMRRSSQKASKKAAKTKEMLKPKISINKRPISIQEYEEKEGKISQQDIEHYFPTLPDAAVTTYLHIPLAPTPSTRLPLPQDRSSLSHEPHLLPPLTELGEIHKSHSNHALRVSTLFTRLDQANVWASGVRCTAYSHVSSHQFREQFQFENLEGEPLDEFVCTILKIEFSGWTESQVRAVIGESGKGCCVLEEIPHKEELPMDEGILDTDSLASTPSESPVLSDRSLYSDGEDQTFDFDIDPAQSLVLPTINFSASFDTPSPESSMLGFLGGTPDFLPSETENNPWAGEYDPSDNSLSPMSSVSGIIIIDPPSENGWFDLGRHLGSEYEQRSDSPVDAFLL